MFEYEYQQTKSSIHADIEWIKDILSNIDPEETLSILSFESRLEEVEKELEELENEHRKSHPETDEGKGRL